MTDIEIPREIGRTAQDWDEQAIDLRSSSQQVSRASSAGFTAAVTGSASTFTSAWTSMLDDLASAAERRADGMRDTLQAMADEDSYVASDLAVQMLLQEQR